MPLPKPKPKESQDDFISRCMGDDLMNEEYPKEKQRLAVCHALWNKNKGEDMNIEYKKIALKIKEDKPGVFAARVATLNVIDNDGDLTKPGAFPKGKTVLVSAYQHGSWAGRLPIGKATLREDKDEVIAEGEFNLETETGREHYNSIKFSGPLQEWSYGFKAIEFEEDEQDGKKVRVLKKVDVFEISPVLKGSGVDTITLAIKAETKGAISYASAHPSGTPKASEDEDWDAGKEVKEAEVDDLKIMCAWVDTKNADNKTAYKLPHHKASGKHPVVWRAVAAAMAALMGARGGIAIPSGDRKGVYNHLVKHYKEFDKEPPEFRELLDGDMTYADQAEMALAAINDLVTRTKSLADLRRKEGRVLSSINRERLQTLLDSVDEVTKEVKEILISNEPIDQKLIERLFLEWSQLESKILTMGIET